MMNLKSSFMSGEFWLCAIIGGVMLFLNYRGISAADIKAHGEGLLNQAQGYITTIGPLLLAFLFGVKRTILKIQKLKAEMTLQIEQIRAGSAGVKDAIGSAGR